MSDIPTCPQFPARPPHGGEPFIVPPAPRRKPGLSVLSVNGRKPDGHGDLALTYIDGAEYAAGYGDPPRPALLFRQGGEVVAVVDATPLLKDGMVSSVAVSDGKLVITFNTDAGKEPVSVPLTEIFDPGAYYDKTAADGRFALKGEMSVAAGTGADADKTTITLRPGVLATVLRTHQPLDAYFNAAEYDSANRKILFKHGSVVKAQIDATAFVKDGMVSTVAISGGNLVIAFNTDAGKAPVSIPLTDIFNPANYYDKTATDELLSAKQDTVSDLAAIRSGAAAGATAYQKPAGGIAASDLAAAVQTSLGKADTALQAQDITGKADKVANANAGNLAALDSQGNLTDSGLPEDEVESLLFPQYYPDGSVKSAADFTQGIKYDAPDTTNRTITVKPFCNKGVVANDNSNLSGRVVIPPFVDASGNGYISDDGTRFKVVGVSEAIGSLSGDNINLTAVIAPNTVTTTMGGAFSGCTALTSVSLVAATTIGASSLADCDVLTSVSLPAATTIGNSAFNGCTSLASVDFGDTPRLSVPSLGEYAFYNVPTTCKIIVPDAQYDDWTAASGWSDLVASGYKFLRHSEWEYARRYELAALRTALAGKQDALSAAQLANIAAVPNKADASTTYTKTEVDAIVQALKTGSREIVETLPASGQPMVIYMVPKSASQTNNSYDEYIWTAADAWEKIGDTEIDLSGYYTKTAANTLLSGKADMVANATNGHFAALTSTGNLVDSGKKASDFATAAQGGLADTAVQPGDLAAVATSGDYDDLVNKPTIPAAQVQSNWNETDTSSKAYIQNKPTIPTVPTDVSAFTNDAGYLVASSAAPAFSSDSTVQYAVGEHCTYNGKLYKCTTATTGGTWDASKWTADTMDDPDAVLDITAQNQLRVVAKDGTLLWAQGYDLASTSSATLACDAVNNFTFTDGATSQAFALPTAPTGKVGDFGLDIDNSANTGAATITLTGLDTAFSVVVPKGESLNDMLAIAAGELARFYITLSTFRVNNLPTWHIVKQIVENGGAQS